MVDARVEKIAKRVRKWAEAYAKRQDKHKTERSRWIDPKVLTGMCGIASGVLLHQLHLAGIRAVISSNTTHAFVVVDEAYIVDVTATQFNYIKPVMIVPLARYETSYWQRIWTHATTKEFRDFQKSIGWISGQIVPKQVLRQKPFMPAIPSVLVPSNR